MTNTNSFGPFSGEGHIQEVGRQVFSTFSDGESEMHAVHRSMARDETVGYDDAPVTLDDYGRVSIEPLSAAVQWTEQDLLASGLTERHRNNR